MQRRKAKKYVKCVMAQRVGPVYVDMENDDDDDLTLVEVRRLILLFSNLVPHLDTVLSGATRMCWFRHGQAGQFPSVHGRRVGHSDVLCRFPWFVFTLYFCCAPVFIFTPMLQVALPVAVIVIVTVAARWRSSPSSAQSAAAVVLSSRYTLSLNHFLLFSNREIYLLEYSS